MSAEALMAEFPGWRVWEGVTGIWYAQTTKRSAPITLRAGSPDELRVKLAKRVRS